MTPIVVVTIGEPDMPPLISFSQSESTTLFEVHCALAFTSGHQASAATPQSCLGTAVDTWRGRRGCRCARYHFSNELFVASHSRRPGNTRRPLPAFENFRWRSLLVPPHQGIAAWYCKRCFSTY